MSPPTDTRSDLGQNSPIEEDALLRTELPSVSRLSVRGGTVTRHRLTRIRGIDGFTVSRLRAEVAAGGRFVVYPFAVSFLPLALKLYSRPNFIAPGKGSRLRGLPYALGSLLLGWWSIPWGVSNTLTSLGTTLHGGRDVTDSITERLIRHSFSPYSGT